MQSDVTRHVRRVSQALECSKVYCSGFDRSLSALLLVSVHSAEIRLLCKKEDELVEFASVRFDPFFAWRCLLLSISLVTRLLHFQAVSRNVSALRMQ
jgi:hypothetical protein